MGEYVIFFRFLSLMHTPPELALHHGAELHLVKLSRAAQMAPILSDQIEIILCVVCMRGSRLVNPFRTMTTHLQHTNTITSISLHLLPSAIFLHLSRCNTTTSADQREKKVPVMCMRAVSGKLVIPLLNSLNVRPPDPSLSSRTYMSSMRWIRLSVSCQSYVCARVRTYLVTTYFKWSSLCCKRLLSNLKFVCSFKHEP